MSYLYSAAKIITENEIQAVFESSENTFNPENIYGNILNNVTLILEDVNSPITQKYKKALFQSLIDKAHIDFENIPESKGNIRNYSGYSSMVKTLETMEYLAKEENANDVLEYVEIIKKAIDNISNLSSTYEKGFTSKATYVALEYNTYVYTCVQATSALLYNFVDYIKDPKLPVMSIKLKSNKLRSDPFFFEQLKKFNAVQANRGIEYRKMLEGLTDDGKNNFIGISAGTIVGIGTIAGIALSIIPITRELIYQMYHIKSKLSEALDMQATFLEMNQSCLENNSSMTEKKKAKVMENQKKLATKLRKMATTLQGNAVKSIAEAKKELKKDNKMFTLDNLRDQVNSDDSSGFELM